MNIAPTSRNCKNSPNSNKDKNNSFRDTKLSRKKPQGSSQGSPQVFKLSHDMCNGAPNSAGFQQILNFLAKRNSTSYLLAAIIIQSFDYYYHHHHRHHHHHYHHHHLLLYYSYIIILKVSLFSLIVPSSIHELRAVLSLLNCLMDRVISSICEQFQGGRFSAALLF